MAIVASEITKVELTGEQLIIHEGDESTELSLEDESPIFINGREYDGGEAVIEPVERYYANSHEIKIEGTVQ